MNLGDTIVASIGGNGSPRGLVRISGPRAIAGVERLCGAALHGRGIGAVRIRMAAGELPALAIVYRRPRSYSGEDTIELLLPGNRALLARIEGMLVQEEGVRHALPGEFTARAFIHGRLTAEQAEGVGALIAARTQEEHAAAERLVSGVAGAGYRALADELASALALLEAGIDFTDQDDVVAISSTALRGRLVRVLRTIDELGGPGSAREATSGDPLVALVGAPNAGKSTLFNAILRRERAVVSDVAGTTRDVIVEEVDLARLGWVPGSGFGATRLRLADLAGLDRCLTARSPEDHDAQEAARDAIERADVLLWCDPGGRFEAGEQPPGFSRSDRPVIRVRTKADLDGSVPAADIVSVCALDGLRLPRLILAIQDAIARARPSGDVALIPRHAQALRAARESVTEALKFVGDDDRAPAAAEVVATCLREALDQVGSIAGRISPDDVIGRIFATFCIGK